MVIGVGPADTPTVQWERLDTTGKLPLNLERVERQDRKDSVARLSVPGREDDALYPLHDILVSGEV